MNDLAISRIRPWLTWGVLPRAVAALCFAFMLTGMAGCGASRPHGAAGTPDGQEPVAGSAGPGSSRESAPLSSYPSSPAGSVPASTPAGGPPDCQHGRVELSYRLDGPRPGRVCVQAGAELVITLAAPPGYAWTPVESLSPRVVTVLSSGRGAVVTATARAVAAGAAELRWTSSFTGDPFGPPTRLWQLTITVVP